MLCRLAGATAAASGLTLLFTMLGSLLLLSTAEKVDRRAFFTTVATVFILVFIMAALFGDVKCSDGFVKVNIG